MQARREWPALKDFSDRETSLSKDNAILTLKRGKTDLVIYFNLTEYPQALPTSHAMAAIFSSEDALYGGAQMSGKSTQKLAPFECLVCQV